MKKRTTTTKRTKAKAIADCPVDLGPQGLVHYQLLVKALRERGTFEESDRLAVGLAAVALVGFENDRTIQHIAEARAWLSELGLMPSSRARL